MRQIDFHKLSILMMHFQGNFEFSERSAKMKRGTFFLICLCAAQLFCAFSLVCDCIFLLSCYIVLLSCLLSVVVLPASFRNDFMLLSRFGLIPSGFNLSCLVLLLLGRLLALLFFRFLRIVFCKSLVLSRRSALRVFPSKTRLTVHRRLFMRLHCSSLPAA